MTPHATITLASHGLEYRAPTANLTEDRALSAQDYELLSSWADRHQKEAREEHPAAALLALGEEIFHWLNHASFLERLLDSGPVPLIIEFAVGKQESDNATAFLDAPWELLAHNGQHWCLREDTVYCPIRRIGKRTDPPPPSPNQLSLVFMAAAPHGADNLSYEAEEASILDATKDLGMDLVVEESGTLKLLAACVAKEQPDVVQISCHGTLKPEPGLLMEDDFGDPDFAKASQLLNKLGTHHPRLLFLSACESAEPDPKLDSLARSLVRSGAPAVLGWAAPVLDNEASIFAADLYSRLTAGADLVQALAQARLGLEESDQLKDPDQPGTRSHDWHLARLYLSPGGGGQLATAGGPRRIAGRGRAMKAFLDTEGKQVPVAGEQEFVGRRKEIQTILREFRTKPPQHAGVLIHGMGRQGKSSLAARVAHRLDHTHTTIVLYGRYDAQAILGAFRDRLSTPAITEIVNRHLPFAADNPASLRPALTELLEGPCQQERKDRPVLLVVDDFEQALNDSDRRTLKADLIEPIRSLIGAFDNANTDSRLLFTCRYQFTLPTGATDLAGRLLDIPLHGMDEHEARKQASARFRIETGNRHPKNLPELARLFRRIISTSEGNPGLQDLLFSLCLASPAACGRCLDQMEKYQLSGSVPTEQKIQDFLNNLAIPALIALLTPGQRELLRAMTLFELPVRVPVVEVLAGHFEKATGKAVERLIALGLVEVYEDLYQRKDPALQINAIVRPLAGVLEESEQQALAALVSIELFEQWGGEGGGEERRSFLDYELTRIALLAPQPHVLAATGADTLRYLDDRFAYREAAALAKRIMTLMDSAGLAASVDLLRTAAERCFQVGEVKEASVYRARALSAIEREGADSELHAATFLAHGRALSQQGEPNQALQFLKRAQALLPPGREAAIVLGEIARILVDQGQVEEGLRLHQERLEVYEELGDKGSRAVALGDIARILVRQGRVEEGLRLHQERLKVYEELGEKRSRAITLGDIARILVSQGQVEEGLRLHQEELKVHEELGNKRNRAVTLGDIARVLVDRGQLQEGLRRYQEALNICEELGDKKGRAVTLGNISRILIVQGKVEEGLRLQQEKLHICEELGEKRSRAITLGDIAGILVGQGRVEEALHIHQERLTVNESLGDRDGIANTLWSMATIELQQEKYQEAYEHFAKSYEINLSLGRLDGICIVGLDLGQLLCRAGQHDDGMAILKRSRNGFQQLGRTDAARHTQALIDKFSQPPS
jgi:tetratricopeptide (TPR) repeat protein